MSVWYEDVIAYDCVTVIGDLGAITLLLMWWSKINLIAWVFVAFFVIIGIVLIIDLASIAADDHYYDENCNLRLS